MAAATATVDWSVWSTTARIVVTDQSRLLAAEAAVREELAAIEQAISRFRDDSELALLRGRLPGGAVVSRLLAELVRGALDVAALTGGDVDPTLGNPLRLLGYDRDIAEVRSTPVASGASLVVEPLHVAGWTRVQLAGRRLTVPSDLQLDLGASGKAMAADRGARRVADELHCGVLVSLGGDIATAGPGPDFGWQVLAQDTDSDPAAQVTLRPGFALATSSTQKRAWTTTEGRALHHILDPRSLRPAAPVWRSVTVAGTSCLQANALSTAAVVRGHDAIDMLRDASAAAFLVDANGRTVTVGGWPADSIQDSGDHVDG